MDKISKPIIWQWYHVLKTRITVHEEEDPPQGPTVVYSSMLNEAVRDIPNATIHPVTLRLFCGKHAGTVYILNSVRHMNTWPHARHTSCTGVSKLQFMFLHVAGRQGIRLCKDNNSPHLAFAFEPLSFSWQHNCHWCVLCAVTHLHSSFCSYKKGALN